MNLNQYESFVPNDPQKMYSHLQGLPSQLLDAYSLGFKYELPDTDGIDRILIAGMGGSAIGADFVSAYVAESCQLPVIVNRDYILPAWASGERTLVIASSHSGNTEETLAGFKAAYHAGCRIMGMCTGGILKDLCREYDAPCWEFAFNGQPRAAVGLSFGLLLNLFSRAGWIPEMESQLHDTTRTMKSQYEMIRQEIPIEENPAKRLAIKISDSWIAILGSGVLASVARRWKGQFSEIAKTWAQFEFLPEADHNTLAGIYYPREQLKKLHVILLRGRSDHPRNSLRIDLTKQILGKEGISSSLVDALGESPLENMWSLVQMGDYVAYYLAMLQGVDPTAIPAIEGLKKSMNP